MLMVPALVKLVAAVKVAVVTTQPNALFWIPFTVTVWPAATLPSRVCVPEGWMSKLDAPVPVKSRTDVPPSAIGAPVVVPAPCVQFPESLNVPALSTDPPTALSKVVPALKVRVALAVTSIAP